MLTYIAIITTYILLIITNWDNSYKPDVFEIC